MIKKERLLQKVFESAIVYRDCLQDRNFLFVFEVNSNFGFIETLFSAHHFLHLTGIKCSMKAKHFYGRALDKRLNISDFMNIRGTTELKLQVLPSLIRQIASGNNIMIGRNVDNGYRLYTEALIGSVKSCMGFVQEKNLFYVPNTVLNCDIRKQVSVVNSVRMVCSKETKDCKYRKVYLKDGLDISSFSSEIRNRVNVD